jgi:hypothetical protein
LHFHLLPGVDDGPATMDERGLAARRRPSAAVLG